MANAAFTAPQLGSTAYGTGVGSNDFTTGNNGMPFNQNTYLSGQTPDLFGTGQYNAQSYFMNPNAFNNPAGDQGQNLNNALGSYLPNTTQGVTAQTAGQGNYGNYNAGTAGQLGLAQQYQNMAAGGGPSLATVQAGQQGAQNL